MIFTLLFTLSVCGSTSFWVNTMQNCRGAIHCARLERRFLLVGAMNCAPTNHLEGWRSRQKCQNTLKQVTLPVTCFSVAT